MLHVYFSIDCNSIRICLIRVPDIRRLFVDATKQLKHQYFVNGTNKMLRV